MRALELSKRFLFIANNPAQGKIMIRRVMTTYTFTLLLITTFFIGNLPLNMLEIVSAGTSIDGGHITTDTIWNLSGSPYYIEGDIYVDDGVNLTIESGVEVKFNGYYGLTINGSLDAVGKSDKRINFTSNLSSPGPADWKFIRIHGIGNISYCRVYYADIGLDIYSQFNNITYSDLQYNHDHGIYVRSGSQYNMIIGNYFDHNGGGSPLDGSTIYIYGGGLNIIRNNVILNSTWIGIRAFGGPGQNTIENNIIKNCMDNGIVLWSDDNVLINNTIYSSDEGIEIKNGQQRNYIKDCRLESNTKGIFNSGGDYTKIINCTFISNGLGFFMNGGSGGSYNNIINDSYFIGNNNGVRIVTPGIALGHVKLNQIITSTFENNNVGVYISDSSDSYNPENNMIYHNNFINNTQHAYDDTNNLNQWDNGYPSGGNYWSNYTGEDHFKGPNQDILGRDGIGDTNYLIDSNSKDRYPLMGQYLNYSIEDYIILRNGWNLISIPRIQSNTSLSSVLKEIQENYDAVQWYNSTENNDNWKHYHIGKPSYLNDLTCIDLTMGFYLHILAPNGITMTLTGTSPFVNQSIHLYKGWNMVGYPSLTNYNRTEGLNNLTFDTDVDSIWTYDAATQKWKELGPSDYFEIGKGYWVHAKLECTWEVPL